MIRWHLSGEDEHHQPFVAGVYPLLPDESCYLLAAGFDKANWQDDATAFLQTCCELELDAAWSDRGQVAAGVSGSSSIKRFRRRSRGDSVRTC